MFERRFLFQGERYVQNGCNGGLDFYEGALGFSERVSTVEVYVGQVFFVDRKCRTLPGSVFVYAALARPVFQMDQEGTTEQDFAAVPAMITLALPAGNLFLDESLKESADHVSPNFTAGESDALSHSKTFLQPPALFDALWRRR